MGILGGHGERSKRNKERKKSDPFKAIPNGVLNIPAEVTSSTEENYKMGIDESYPICMMALTKLGLNMKPFLTLEELWENAVEQEKNRKGEKYGREL